ncbi:uncharacterized protein LOC107974786 [Pan troglodytes]|uniref:uncharacterized protein LOC107974786 n=1 Tax=Pan troglodytes TaxID=9598 RepID=UPI00301396DA
MFSNLLSGRRSAQGSRAAGGRGAERARPLPVLRCGPQRTWCSANPETQTPCPGGGGSGAGEILTLCSAVRRRERAGSAGDRCGNRAEHALGGHFVTRIYPQNQFEKKGGKKRPYSVLNWVEHTKDAKIFHLYTGPSKTSLLTMILTLI